MREGVNMAWQISEEKAYKWFKKNYDPNAIQLGGYDCTVSDIQSPLYGLIEVKEIVAQCGQFVQSTINQNPISKIIAAKAVEDVTPDECRAWCRYHYIQRGVKYVIIVDGDNFELYPINDFFDKWNFAVTYRNKSSGSNALTKRYWDQIPKTLKVVDALNSRGTKCKFCPDRTLWGSNRKYPIIFPVKFYDGSIRRAGINSKGIVSVLSETKNPTWIFRLAGKK